MRGPQYWRNVLGSMRVRILAAVVVLLAGSSAVSILLLRDALRDRLDEEIVVDLQQEMQEFELLAAGIDPGTGQPFGNDIESVFDLYFAREVPDAGETLLAFLGGELHHAERAEGVAGTDRIQDAMDFWLRLPARTEGQLETGAGSARYIALPLSDRAPDGLFVVAHFAALERKEIDEAVLGQALAQAAMIAVASLIGWWLAGRVLRPLASLADTARTISETDLTRRIPVRGDDEASLIAVAFNDMLSRLDSAFQAQRRFLNEASHELRAPLTVIRGHVDLLDLEDDPVEREQTMALIASEIERMNRMVEDLLTLARAQRPDFLEPGPVDLQDWTTELFRNASVLCHRHWTLDAAARGTVVADRQRLTQAVMQLAENACAHADPAASVRIGSAFEGAWLLVWVRDTGPGVPADQAERIFHRFQRGNSGRRGSGLGLSIVRAIAEAHGGTVALVPQSGPGARFEIRIPALPGPATP